MPIPPLQQTEHIWSTDPDSNRIRAGLQSAASTASAFGAEKPQTLAGEEGLEPSNARVRAECSGRYATPQFPGCGGRYRAGLSAFSEQRFHLISFPAMHKSLGGREGNRTPVEA